MLKNISKVGGLTLVSRVFGFVRDVLMAKFLGASLVADCFFVAFKLPNFFRRLFAEGAFNAAFVPIFNGVLGKDKTEENKQKAYGFAQEALGVLLPILLIFTALMQIFMPWVMIVLAPGFVSNPEKFNLAVEFTRATFPYLMMISLVSLMGGILNSIQRFAAAAAAPILLNLVLITTLLLFHDDELIAGVWLSRGVSVAGIVQFLWLLYALKQAGVNLRLPRPRLSPRVKELGIIMFPAALGAGAVQLNLLVDIVLASFLPEGSLSYLFYADRLTQLPIGVIGVAVGTVLLPTLSRSIAMGDVTKAAYDQNRAMESALFFTIPAAIALFILPIPLITVLFERGAFDNLATSNTAMALSAYAVGLPAYVLIKVLTPAFFARKDTKTPVKIAMFALLLNVILNLALMGPFKHVGLAAATAISAWVNVGFLYIYLKKHEYFEMDTRLKSRGWRMIAAALIMGVFCSWLMGQVSGLLVGTALVKISAILLLVLGGMVVYGVLAHFLGAMKMDEIKAMIKRKPKAN
jgi:putative peptidoglycan lipid II flippase